MVPVIVVVVGTPRRFAGVGCTVWWSRGNRGLCRILHGDPDGPTRQRRHTAFSEAYLRLAPIPVVAYCRDTHSQGRTS